jgi:predicted dehydrogenase
MRALVVGLGSMGKRRIRGLASLGVTEIVGVDPRADRRESALAVGCVAVDGCLDSVLAGAAYDVALVCTEPSVHMSIAERTVAARIDTFIEASVVEPERISTLGRTADGLGVIVCPSSTMRFFPGPTLLRALVRQEVIGRPLFMRYHVGQWLPDWHPWESVAEYYVGRRETGGCREIVPFELAWIVELFGRPQVVAAWKGKVSHLEVDIDDIYTFTLLFPNSLVASMTVEVLSRPDATRVLSLVGSQGVAEIDGETKCVRHRTIDGNDWRTQYWLDDHVESGYSSPEAPYVEELACFLDTVSNRDASRFPNSMVQDRIILDILAEIESACQK